MIPTRCLLVTAVKMRNIRHGVAPGWLGFWDARVKPQGDYEPHYHGNRKHGRYSKGGKAATRELRQIIRVIRTGCGSGMTIERPPGWRLYPHVRNEVDPQRDEVAQPNPTRARANANPRARVRGPGNRQAEGGSAQSSMLTAMPGATENSIADRPRGSFDTTTRGSAREAAGMPA